jgi:hypothetical protein
VAVNVISRETTGAIDDRLGAPQSVAQFELSQSVDTSTLLMHFPQHHHHYLPDSFTFCAGCARCPSLITASRRSLSVATPAPAQLTSPRGMLDTGQTLQHHDDYHQEHPRGLAR